MAPTEGGLETGGIEFSIWQKTWRTKLRKKEFSLEIFWTLRTSGSKEKGGQVLPGNVP